MGGIGDYIHYFAKGYDEYGVALNTKDGVSYGQARQKQKAILEKRQHMLTENNYGKNSAELKAIEDILNSMYKDLNSLNSKDTEIYKYLEEKMGKDLETINFETLKSERVSNGQNVLRKIQEAEGQQIHKMTTLQNRVNAIMRIGEEIKNTQRHGYANLRKRIKSIENQWERLSTGLTEKDILVKGSKGVNTLVKSINDVISLIKKDTAANITGALLEHMIEAIPEVGEGLLDEEMKKVFKESALIGGEHGQNEITIDMKNFDVDIPGIDFTNGKYTVTHSQGKIDVILSPEDDKLKPINVTAKNYSSLSGIHVVSGQSLLYLLQNEDVDFVNHYLNLACLKDGDTKSMNEGFFTDAASILSQSILSQVVAGATYGKGSNEIAGVMVIAYNDTPNSTKFKVIPTVNLIASLVDKADNVDRLIKSYSVRKAASKQTGEGSIDLSKYHFYQNWEGEKYKYDMNLSDVRIGKILQKVHSTKINASINLNI